MNIEVNKEFKELIPPLSNEEYSQLEISCKTEGIRDKLILWNDYIIDGHNRYEIAQKHNLDFEVTDKEFENESDVKVWIIQNQFGRRNLSAYERSVLALKLESIFSEKAKENQIQGGEVKQISAKAPINTRQELSKIAGVSHDTIHKVKRIQANATPEIKEKLRTGEISINQGFKEIKKNDNQRAKEERIKAGKNIIVNDITFINDDFRNVEIENNSIDLIITDPPYPSEYLPLWNDLGKFAFEKLKAGGFLVAYSGQYHLPTVINSLSNHLNYYWTFCLYHKGTTQIINARNIICRWKPILIFYKEPLQKNIITMQDYIESEQREKDGHKWQQSESGVRKLIEVFSKPGDKILDPFMCAGTFPIVAKELKREAIGIEINKDSFSLAKERYGTP